MILCKTMGDRPKWCVPVGLLFLACVLGSMAAETLEEKMKNDPDLSEFYGQLELSQLAAFALKHKQVTVFAPINAAFQNAPLIKDDNDTLVLYHLISVPKRTDQLGSSYTSLSSELSGNPPLWITHISGRYHDDIYVNNARIFISQSDIQISGKDFIQVLHKIDQVLIPTRSPRTASNAVYNPTAWEFLENYESLIQHPHRLRTFRQKVIEFSKKNIFQTEGGHTFFISVDEGFENERPNLIDDKIIDSHVIHGKVLFTSPTKKDVPFKTLAYSDNIKVVISFTQEQQGTIVTNFVKSHNLYGDSKHTPGVVLAKIVKPNIPVKNGVIHLIHKPLMVVDGTVRSLLQEHMDYICNIGNVPRKKNISNLDPKYSETPEYTQGVFERDDGILSNFLNAIKDVGPEGQEFLKTIERSHDVTLFAPCNKALEDDLKQNAILADPRKFMELVKMHLIVDDRLYINKIVDKNIHKASTLNKGKSLYFNFVNNGTVLTVEGGGVTATVIQPDLAATNGIIHVIDRVLGIPYNTVYDKLKADPTLSNTFSLGNLQGFNKILNDTSKKFTYFVPRNKAWADAKVKLPSAIKKLFMGEYAFHATSTLERHLVISDLVYTMERIKQLTNETDSFGRRRDVELPAMRGSLKLYVNEVKDKTFSIMWNGEEIPVFRPNIECTNGIIHVIDAPFLREGDIRVSSGCIIMFAPELFMVLIAKILFL
ncbi:fasciclin-1 isoform X2 [Anoplophora glabripennis]|uniref:fasciclin-1 isoform X2 n=1 Tax=Anoplophora glabripennis TaxID=217634 RepID=UPI0008741450|nr:fasciclin-1 isoform X2 [Anoplophora glabripennis]